MYQKELDALIANGKHKDISSFLFFGQCRYLSNLYCEKIIADFAGESDVFKMYFDEYDFEGAKSFLSQNSLFGDRLILVIKHDKKIPKKEIKELIEVARKNSGTLVYELYDDISVKKEDYHLNFGSFTRFFQPDTIYAVLALIKVEVLKRGVNISEANLTKIITALGLDLELVSNEIRKLAIYDCEINDEIIDKVLLGGENITHDKFYEIVLSYKHFANELEFVLEKQGANEVEIILSFERYVYDILMAKLGIKLFGDAKAALPIYQKGLPDKILKVREHFAKSIRDENLSKIIDVLLQCEYELKNTNPNSDKKLLLTQALIKIQSFL